jgi:hypothetical protein
VTGPREGCVNTYNLQRRKEAETYKWVGWYPEFDDLDRHGDGLMSRTQSWRWQAGEQDGMVPGRRLYSQSTPREVTWMTCGLCVSRVGGSPMRGAET